MAAGTVKIGVLVSDATSSEALAFRAYYTEYIAKAYNVEFIYSDELSDAAGEKSAIDNFIVNNCKAVISFSSFDRPAQIDQCEAAGIYYAVATGTLTDEQYDTRITSSMSAPSAPAWISNSRPAMIWLPTTSTTA